MRIDAFSEFSYGYALTENLVGGMKGGISAAPVFPSLRLEGKQGGGYDVEIPTLGGVPLFLQFKVPEFLRTNRAAEAQARKLRAPFFRMHLYTRLPKRGTGRVDRMDQHSMLLELEKEKAPNSIFYVAPCFSTVDELNDAYLSRAVDSRSRWIPPSTIGPITDDDSHSVSFESPSGPICKSSEPEHLDGPSDFDHFLAVLSSGIESHSREPLEGRLTDLLDSMTQMAQGHGLARQLNVMENRFQGEVHHQLAYLAQTYFGQ